MEAPTTLEEVMRLARNLSAVDKLKVIERLAPAVEAALRTGAPTVEQLDEQYQRGYEQVPDDPADAQALSDLIPLPEETW